jgi:hypothetical protein
MPAEQIEKILEPKRLVRIFGSIFLAVVLFFALVMGVKMAISAMNRVEATSRDHAWFKSQIEEIRSHEHRISETHQALADHKKEVDGRWISRADDRAQTQNLTKNLFSLEEDRASLISEYNIAADLASDAVLKALPRNVSIEEEKHELKD